MLRRFTNIFTSRIQYQLLIPIILLVVIPTILTGYVLSSELFESDLQALNLQEELETELLSREINLFLGELDDDLLILSDLQNTTALAQAILVDDAVAIEQASDMLAQEFQSFAQARDVYGQIRFISATGASAGNEVVRVDYDLETRNAEVVEGSFKGDRGYYLNTVGLAENDIYISPVNLNREGQPPQIEVTGDVADGQAVSNQQLVPVVRYGKPIFAENTTSGRYELAGILVTNVYMERLFELLELQGDASDVFLLNSDGYYLYNSNRPEITFAFEPDISELNRPQGDAFAVDNLISEDFASVVLNPQGVDIARDITYEIGDESFIAHAETIRPQDAPADYYWVVGTAQSQQAIIAPLQRRVLTTGIQIALVALVAAGIGTVLANRITRPISVISERAQRIADGQYDTDLEAGVVNRRDEIGQLDRAFSDMAQQVSESVTMLESRVQSRTQDLATSAEIARAANQVRDRGDLLSLTVNLIRDRFDFYYTQVYLIDETRQYAVLADGTGYVGRRLLSRQHRLELDGTSLVSTAIESGEPVIVQNTEEDDRWRPNDLLPETRSEAVIPLRAQDAVIGALDIQHDQPNIFDPETVQLFRTLAEQLAVTFENVNLLDNVSERAKQLQTVSEVAISASTEIDVPTMLRNACKLARENFNLYHAHVYLLDKSGTRLNLAAGAGEVGLEMVANKHRIAMNKEGSLVASAARTREGVVANDITNTENFLPNPLLPDTRAELSVPMLVGNTLIGVFDFQSDQVGFFTEADVQVYSILASQLAVAVNNANLFRNVQDIQSAIDQHAIVAQTDQTGIITYANDKFAEVSQYDIDELIGQDHRIINSGYHSEEFIRNLWVTIAKGETWQGEIRNQAKDGTYYWVDTTIVPFLNDEGKPYQYIAIRSDITERKEAEANLINRAQELEAVANVSAQMTSQLDSDELLWTVANLTKENFDRYHAHIYLLNEAGTHLELRAGAGDIGRMMASRGHRIAITASSIVAHAARDRQTIVNPDVINAEDFLPNPLLPDTQSELAVPIMYGDELLGVLDVQDDKPNQFTDLEQQVKETLANQIAVAIKNAEAFADIRRSQQEVDRIFNSTLDMLGSANFDGYLIRLNDAWENTLGWTREELMSRPFVSFVHPDDVEETQAEAAKIGEGAKSIRFTNRYRTKSGDYRWLSWNATPDMDAGLINFVARDITDERAAQAEIRRISSLVETSTDFIGNASLDGVIEYINPAGVRMAGYDSLDEMLGKPLDMLKTEAEMGEITTQAIPQALASGEWRKEHHLKRRDGTLLPVEQTVFPIYDEQGNPRGMATIMRDITERQQSEQEIQRRAAELETVARVSAATTTILDVQELLDAVVNLTKASFDLYHAHIYLYDEQKQAMVLAAGAGDAGQVMKDQGHRIPLDHQSSVVVEAATLKEGVMVNDVFEGESFLPNPLLPETRSELAVPLIVGDDLIGVLDVQSTEVGHFTEEDVQIKTTLADQVAVAVRNAQAFERERRTVERLREVDRLKQQFLANMSHELRTPLNSIIGYSEVLLDGVDGDLTDDAIEDVDAIYTSGRHLLSIINEILDLAKIEAGQMELSFKEFDLTNLLDDVVKANQILVKDKPVEMRLVAEDDIPSVYIDQVRINQVMLNLVSNATKFTEEGSITVRYGMHGQQEIYVRVEDTGMGMSDEQLEVIFERFRQVDGSSTRRAGGTGLGLTITKQLIEMHGGTIHVESAPDVGTTFWFTLPTLDRAKHAQENGHLTGRLEPEAGD